MLEPSAPVRPVRRRLVYHHALTVVELHRPQAPAGRGDVGAGSSGAAAGAVSAGSEPGALVVTGGAWAVKLNGRVRCNCNALEHLCPQMVERRGSL